MKFRTALMIPLAVGAMMSPAFAGPEFTGGLRNLDPYVGANIGLLRYDESGAPGFSPSAIMLRAGVPLNPYLAIEGRLGTGLSSDQNDGGSVSVGTFGGAYAKGSLALGPILSLYGVAGIATVNLNRNFRDGSTTDTGLSAGIGGDVQLQRRLALNFEWTYLPGGTDAGHSYDSALFSVGVNYAF
jgi:opacity protein-like surface antigen